MVRRSALEGRTDEATVAVPDLPNIVRQRRPPHDLRTWGRSSSSAPDGVLRCTPAMSQLLVRAPDRFPAPGKAKVSDVGRKQHPPGPFDEDAELTAEGRHLRQVIGAPDQPGGQPADRDTEHVGHTDHMSYVRHHAA